MREECSLFQKNDVIMLYVTVYACLEEYAKVLGPTKNNIIPGIKRSEQISICRVRDSVRDRATP